MQRSRRIRNGLIIIVSILAVALDELGPAPCPARAACSAGAWPQALSPASTVHAAQEPSRSGLSTSLESRESRVETGHDSRGKGQLLLQ